VLKQKLGAGEVEQNKPVQIQSLGRKKENTVSA